MELKPCPFCGSEKVSLYDAGVWSYAHCNRCAARTDLYKHPDYAAENWNRRVIDVDALREVVDELECDYRPKDYASVDALCELSNDASKALAERIRKAVGL